MTKRTNQTQQALLNELFKAGVPVPTDAELRPYGRCITLEQYRDAQMNALMARMLQNDHPWIQRSQ